MHIELLCRIALWWRQHRSGHHHGEPPILQLQLQLSVLTMEIRSTSIDRPSQRREMAETAVERRGVSIALACRAFGVSETCYRYSPKLKDENEVIADLLTGLTDARKTWGFGLCFLHLRNVKGHAWNHKRVYRIYCELELNLRIKPRKRLKREKPDGKLPIFNGVHP